MLLGKCIRCIKYLWSCHMMRDIKRYTPENIPFFLTAWAGKEVKCLFYWSQCLFQNIYSNLIHKQLKHQRIYIIYIFTLIMHNCLWNLFMAITQSSCPMIHLHLISSGEMSTVSPSEIHYLLLSRPTSHWEMIVCNKSHHSPK